MEEEKDPKPEAIQLQLERILQSPEFKGSAKQAEFLRFVVTETLKGNTQRLKGYTIALAVYGRTEKFDAQRDSIVRVEAGRLRRALERYYLTAGFNDPIHIEIPKGRYEATFQLIDRSPVRSDPSIADRSDSTRRSDSSIAVLPLLNLGGDDRQEYFTDGLTEELTSELSRFQDFQVIASQSTLRFKNQRVDPQQAGAALGVRFLVSGSFRKDASKAKISIQLLDTLNGMQIWGENYNGRLTAGDLISMQEKIAREVVGVIADQYGMIVRQLSKESRKKAPADMAAYDAVLRFYRYELTLTPEAFAEALETLERAVKIDPEYDLAWSMLGHLHADNHALGFCEIEAPLEKAMVFAQKGLALAPKSQFAHDAVTLVHFHRGDKEQFLKGVERTLELNPNSPYFVGVSGWHLALFGEWEHGLALLEKGMKLNPYYPSWFHLAPFVYHYHHGEFAEALDEAMKFNCPSLFWDPLIRTVTLVRIGRMREAEAAAGELLALEPDFAKSGRRLMGRYIKVKAIIDSIIEALGKAGISVIA